MQKTDTIKHKIILISTNTVAVFSLSACQHMVHQQPQSEPITQAPVYITPATYQAYRQEEAQNRTLIIYFEEGKKQNLMNAINAKGDTVIYDYKVFNAVAITIKADESTSSMIDFYQKIDGVLQAVQSQINSLDEVSPLILNP